MPYSLQTYWNDGFHKVDGWVLAGLKEYLERVQRFQDEQHIVGNILEIGVFEGRFLIALAHMARPGESCVALDVFDQQDKNLDGAGKGDLAKLEDNFRRFAPDGVDLVCIRADSLGLRPEEKAQLCKDNGPFRLISIDGCHTCEHTFNDLLSAQDWLAAGGVITLDDYYNMHWPGVHEGCSAFYMKYTPRIKPVLYTNNKLFLTSFASHRSYFRMFAEHFRSAREFKVVSMYGSEVVTAA